MDVPQGSRPSSREDVEGHSAGSLAPAALAWSGRGGAWLVVALWAGLVAGFAELVVVVLRAHLAQHGLYRQSHHLFWMIPASNLAIFGAVGLVLAFVVRAWPRVGPRLAGLLLGTLAMMPPLLAVPGLRAGASLILAGGLACWAAPALRRRPDDIRRLVRATLPALGLAVLALAGIASRGPWLETPAGDPTASPPAHAPNVLLVVMDTVRADATSLDGQGRDTTPNLAALARRGARFDRAIAPSPWTLPSHASLFTGRWPSELLVGLDRPLDDRFPTLAEHLAGRGYATGGFVANTVFCAAEYGLGRGFDRYEDFVVTPLEVVRGSALGWLLCRRALPVVDRLHDARGLVARHPLEEKTYRKDADEINRAALGWIAAQGDRPFFAFLNYLDAHDPYLVPAGAERPFRGRPETLAERRVLRDWISEPPLRDRSPEEMRLARDAYDDCLAYLDDQIGRLVDGLDRLGRLDDTVIVITSDHGEHFGEHHREGFPIVGHRASVYQAEIHVPLLIVAPGRVPAGTVVERAASLRDLPATIVDLLGLDADGPFPGRSLLRPSGPSARAALAEFTPEVDRPVSQRYHGDAPGLMRAVVADGKSYHHHAGGHEEFYDLRADPSEARDLLPESAGGPTLESYRAWLRHLIAPSEQPAPES